MLSLDNDKNQPRDPSTRIRFCSPVPIQKDGLHINLSQKGGSVTHVLNEHSMLTMATSLKTIPLGDVHCASAARRGDSNDTVHVADQELARIFCIGEDVNFMPHGQYSSVTQSTVVEATVDKVFEGLVEFTSQGGWGYVRIAEGSRWPIHIGSSYVSPGFMAEARAQRDGTYSLPHFFPPRKLTVTELVMNRRLGLKIEGTNSGYRTITFDLRPTEDVVLVVQVDRFQQWSSGVRWLDSALFRPLIGFLMLLQRRLMARKLREFKRYVEGMAGA